MAKKFLLITTLTLSTVMASVSAQAQDFYTGQVITMASTYCPRGTIELNGQTLAISQNSTLYSLLGTNYGGDGRASFAVPDMRGRAIVHYGSGPGLSPLRLGQTGGREYTTLNTSNLPAHVHQETAHDHSIAGHSHTANLATHTGTGNTNTLVNGSFATYPSASTVYASGSPDGANAASGTIVVDATNASETGQNVPASTQSTGNNQSFGIRDPFITLRTCMVTDGIYPPRN